MNQRLGIFGGTFNPPHMGHLIVAEHVREFLKLDKVFFVPSYISPHKKAGEELLSAHRFNMVRLAVRNHEAFEASDVEINIRDTSYTFKTIETFRRSFPESRLFLMIGADNLAEFHTWAHPEKILKLATLVVMTRPSYPRAVKRKRIGSGVRYVTVPEIGIASSEIRERIRRGRSVRYLVPGSVQKYILQHRLYR